MKHTNRQDTRPSFQWYPDDWLNAPDLRLCTSAARGLWMDMLCLMWQGAPRGTLRMANGWQISAGGLAKLTANRTRDVRRWLRQLEKAGVFSRLEDKTIYCRRMYREWDLRRVRAEAGRLGAASKWASKTMAKRPSSSSSSSSSSKDYGKSHKEEDPESSAALLRKLAPGATNIRG